MDAARRCPGGTSPFKAGPGVLPVPGYPTRKHPDGEDGPARRREPPGSLTGRGVGDEAPDIQGAKAFPSDIADKERSHHDAGRRGLLLEDAQQTG
ncbi:hypothetical protein NDU88_003790 [Pleurodeles waltl]|uniref:Uncharacterized protein n=1 Tax=Pleurodeles waltl TaxID=8319 RepID=A0AAV7NHH9_PLEWA|nr:hypothetical protein NDU88_003790 [Pleurodeles waltl]